MKKNVAWNVAGSFFYTISQWIITILIVYLGSYEQAGYLSLAMATTSSFAVISLFNVRGYQISDVNHEFSTGIYVGARVISCVASFIACCLYTILKNDIYISVCIGAFMLVRIAEAVVDVMHGIDQMNDRYDIIGKSYIIRGLLTCIPFFITYLISHDLAVTLLVIACLNLLSAFIFDVRISKKIEIYKVVLVDKKVIQLFKACIPMVIFSFALNLVCLITKEYLEQIQGAEVLGIYSSMASPTLVVQVFASVVFNPFIPKVAELYQNKKKTEIKKMMKAVYCALIGLACFSFGIGMMVGKFGLRLLYGESILEYYYLFAPIIGCTVGLSCVWTLSSIMIAMRRIYHLMSGMCSAFGVCLICYKPIINRFAANGVSYTQILVYILFFIFMIAVCSWSINGLEEG